jgi:hypothetical protein
LNARRGERGAHRKWMSYGLESTRSLQSKTLLIPAVADDSEGAGEDRNHVNDNPCACKAPCAR